ncbi:MAG: branched-chain amino acid transport system permease protein [Solirubrobacterales bacterium]|jgi:neutral amino acid transport system permease protein|nr:branched-chain amino acid transport system permease protein [Solirubrobacterales bacterium]
MEAGTLAVGEHDSGLARLKQAAGDHPARTALILIGLLVVVMIAAKGLHQVAETGLSGLSTGSIYALGAVGLTLVYGILKLVNFAHGDFVTLGAYLAYLANVTWGWSIGLALVVGLVGVAALGVLTEKLMWAPMRRKRAGLLQLVLMSIGLAFLIRSVIQFEWGTSVLSLDVNKTATVQFLGLSIGRTQLITIIIGIFVISAIGLMLRFTLLGKRMRALSDDLDLAETAGIDTERIILYTWLFAGGLAGLAGVLAGTILPLQPELGFTLLLAMFASVILGGIGDAFGALVGGMVLGLATEWSTMFIDSRWKLAVGFVVLILVLIVRPQGIFGKAKVV